MKRRRRRATHAQHRRRRATARTRQNGAGPVRDRRRRCLWPPAAHLQRQVQTEATFLARADLRFAAWFLWITPLLTALSSLRDADRSAAVAFSASPASTAVRTERARVRSSLLTALLRSVRLAFVRLRLIWDLMFATNELSRSADRSVEGVEPLRDRGGGVTRGGGAHGTHDLGVHARSNGTSGPRRRPKRPTRNVGEIRTTYGAARDHGTR